MRDLVHTQLVRSFASPACSVTAIGYFVATNDEFSSSVTRKDSNQYAKLDNFLGLNYNALLLTLMSSLYFYPLMYRRLKEAAPGEVGWGELMHWMWPLFTDRWATWRSQRLHLSACPLTDPVTELPIVHDWPRATPLLYGFSREVVECPAYWPASIHVCGFWYAPIEWEVSHANLHLASSKASLEKIYKPTWPKEAVVEPAAGNVHTQHPHVGITSKDMLLTRNSNGVHETIKSCLPYSSNELHSIVLDNKYTDLQGGCIQPVVDIGSERDYQVRIAVNSTVGSNPKLNIVRSNNYNYVPSIKLSDFLLNANNTSKGDIHENRLLFVGFSSMGSMGFLERSDCMLKVLEAVLEATCSRAILLTAGYLALDLAVTKVWEMSSTQNAAMESKSSALREGLCLYNNRLFCYSGSIPYAWLLPQCSVAVHHGGSGTTAACLKSGIPQVICPFVLDQFYWAERMEWLGVAPAPLRPEHLMPDLHEDGSVCFTEAVRAFTSAVMKGFSEECKQCASSLRNKIQEEDGISAAVCILTEDFCS